MGFLDIFADAEVGQTDSKRIGVMRGEVIDNIDLLMQGRVQVKFPALPGVEVWAPVCSPFAGDGYGLWCMPQNGDAVIVDFEYGDPTRPIVVGSIWDGANAPPIDQPLDAQNKRIFKTPRGHSVVFDDLELSITITHLAGHTITLDTKSVTIELAKGQGSLTIETPGAATLKGAVSAEVTAKQTKVTGDVTLDLSSATTTVKADATCRVSGSLVTIN